jgi:sulfide:quinone oxidoreductase
VIVGGGVAGLELLFALEELAGDRAAVTVLAPTAEFVYKPLTVQEPFSPEPATRLELEPLVTETGAAFIQRGMRRIDPARHLIELDDGDEIGFDLAAICVGARADDAFAGAATLRTSGQPMDVNTLLRQAGEHESGRIAFIVPPTGSWPLPVYELALMAEGRARELGLDLRITIVTPEPAPLFVFGPVASDAVASMLAARGIEVTAGARAGENESGDVVLQPSGERLDAGAMVALPRLSGPRIEGLPSDENGFIPIDVHARVHGVDDVYAAGDGTNFPIKHGGLGSQQADAAAEEIAARAGAEIEPAAFHPVIRGRLITGAESLNLEADVAGGGGEGISSLDYLWWPPQKIAGRYLSARLEGRSPEPLGPPPEHGIEVEVSLGHDWHRQPLGLDPLG